MASRYPPAWLLGTDRPLGGEDPREHGARPQHHARAVGLDERPEDPLLHLGLGQRLAGGRVEALAQLRPPHPHQHRRARQGRRLRDHAGRSEAALAPGLPAAAVLQRAPDAVLRVGRRGSRPRLRGDPQGDEVEAAAARRAEVDRDEDRPAGDQGLRHLPGAQRAQGLQARRCSRTSPRTSSATSGRTRSSSAATSPTRPTRTPRRRRRTRAAAPGTSASSSAR